MSEIQKGESVPRLNIIEDRLIDVLSRVQDQANYLGTFTGTLLGSEGEASGEDKKGEEPGGKLDKIDTIIRHIQNEQGRIDYEIRRLQEIA